MRSSLMMSHWLSFQLHPSDIVTNPFLNFWMQCYSSYLGDLVHDPAPGIVCVQPCIAICTLQVNVLSSPDCVSDITVPLECPVPARWEEPIQVKTKQKDHEPGLVKSNLNSLWLCTLTPPISHPLLLLSRNSLFPCFNSVLHLLSMSPGCFDSFIQSHIGTSLWFPAPCKFLTVLPEANLSGLLWSEYGLSPWKSILKCDCHYGRRAFQRGLGKGNGEILLLWD